MTNEKKIVEERISRLKPIMKERGYSLKCREKVDNNGMKYGVEVIPVSSTITFGITLFYEPDWCEKSDEELADLLVKAFNYLPQLEQDMFMEKSVILSKVKPLIYSIENLKNFSKTEIFYKKTEDFLILFYVRFEKNWITKITYPYMEKLKIQEEELVKHAFENLKADLMILCNNLRISDEDVFPMYAITNQKVHLGASAILLPDVYKILSEKLGEKFIILPSSIHECLAIPFVETQDPFVEMVKEINVKMVHPSEKLSDHLYLCTENGVSRLE